jgi:hypothetical protein
MESRFEGLLKTRSDAQIERIVDVSTTRRVEKPGF